MKRPATVFEWFWKDLERSDPDLYVNIEVLAVPAKRDPMKDLELIAKDAARAVVSKDGRAITPVIEYLKSHDAKYISLPKERTVCSSIRARDVMTLATQPYVALIMRDST